MSLEGSKDGRACEGRSGVWRRICRTNGFSSFTFGQSAVVEGAEGPDCAGIAQAPAPAHLIKSGVPSEALLAQVAVAKFSEHMPLYRQSQVFARHGVMLDRAVLADWMGTTAFHLAPIVERMNALMKLSGRLFMDETRAPVLDPGRGRTKTGYLWAVLRDDRGHGGADPPIVVYHYAPGRSGEYSERILEGFDGILQVDGYGGYHRLARAERRGGAPLRLALCWSHGRREIIAATPKAGSPIAEAILARIAALYAIEAEIRGKRGSDPAERSRRAVSASRRRARRFFARPSRAPVRPQRLGKAVAYLLNHWDGLTLFLDDGCIEMDTNLVENQIRPLTKREALCALSSSICKHWKRVRVDNTTRATFTGHRRFHRVRRQVLGPYLMRGSGDNLHGRKDTRFDQSPNRMVGDP